MSTRNLVLSLVSSLALSLAFGSAAFAETPGLGKTISEADIKGWNIDVLPDGTNMPPGSGTPAQGAPIYAQKCAVCHGEKGEKPAPGYGPMVGIKKFDKIDAPKTLTDNEVYALSAYILSLNKIIGENDVMNAQTLPKVKMPNAGKFTIPYPDRI